MDFIQEFKTQASGELKHLSVKRLFILSLIAGCAVAAVFTAIYFNSAEIAAYGPAKASIPGNAPDVTASMNDNGIRLMNDTFDCVCSKDKEYALCYLKKKSKAKAVDFRLYKIKLKENFWTVAKQNNIDVDTIIGCNPELKDMMARKDQVIIVPSEAGVLHQVKAGESLKVIADAFGVGEKDLKDANNIGFFLSHGDMLFIPDAMPAELNENIAKIYEKRYLFRSPLSGRYTSLKGLRHDPILQGVTKFHNGVDISAPIGTWVGAAALGKVLEAGWSNGYGNYVKIAHPNGYTTLYGHLSRIFVHSGQTVKAGSLIAKSGNTGRTTGPHLHFSIFKGNAVMNPLDYLW
jgi:murein DD-endopeptidase MepM/ murein hydrolase activator NlpD